MVLRFILFKSKFLAVGIDVSKNMMILMTFEPTFLPFVGNKLDWQALLLRVLQLALTIRRAVFGERAHNKKNAF